MAHHQHHGSDYDAHISNSLQTHSRPSVSLNSPLSVISEDELAAEVDEPPDHQLKTFTKTVSRPGLLARRESLLTKAFHTDSESHEDENVLKSIISHNPSVSSCSTFSNPSAGDFTSDDGHTSPGTRASTPSSPRSAAAYMKQAAQIQRSVPKITFVLRSSSDVSRTSQSESTLKPAEPTVEAELGRKRCISFMCGAKSELPSENPPVDAVASATSVEAPKRPSTIKFLCPSKVSAPKSPTKLGQHRNMRLHSPAPPPAKSSSPSNSSKRGHRDSDVTIKNESPKPVSHITTTNRMRRLSQNMYPARTEATRFHEFGSSDDETEDWVQEQTCHRSRLTVTDTLKKENVIRQLAEEVEEEALEDDEAEDDIDDSQTDFLSGEDEDAGFQTDDEEGFAESDDDSGDDSDYEWWAPRRSPTASPFISSDLFRKSHPVGSESSYAISESSATSPKTPTKMKHSRPHKFTRPVAIRSASPVLPDSTDFVCGTLDEDRPLEQAYIISRRQREAAKRRKIPQDIDPSFPTSDPEIEQDDEEDEVDDGLDDKVTESDHPAAFIGGRFEAHDDSFRGRRVSGSIKRSPHPSPPRRLLRSPPAPVKRGRSPAPRGMFTGSPRCMRSPPPPNRLTSPPPSRHGSYTTSPAPINMPVFGQALLGMRNHELTHTASLPRSPHPFHRRRKSSNATAVQDSPERARDMNNEDTESDVDKPYARGAIDIVQGLERKRLKRREKLYRQYWKREEKKKNSRPLPGRGAERMRQVGIECAIYHGKRVMSV